MKNSFINFRAFSRMQLLRKCRAFSLVEMLMALLVASLLMVSLAPVMTKKFNESFTITGTMPGTKLKTHEIEYLSSECSNEITDADGSKYCEGEFIVPTGYNGRMTVTLIGAGGGGGVAPTAGIVEYTSPGTKTFTVPAMTSDIETTLVSGGAGGGAGGGAIVSDSFLTDGKTDWTPPELTVGKYVNILGCGGGGGAGGSRHNYSYTGLNGCFMGGGGGSGAYGQTTLKVDDSTPWELHIGGGGGGGSAFMSLPGNKGGYYAGGGGGGGFWGETYNTYGQGGGAGTASGGAGGLARYETQEDRNGKSASPSGGGEGGKGTTATGEGRNNVGSAGGNGGSIAGGGGGGAMVGTGAGGGGGGATRLIINGVQMALWAGGGGGAYGAGCNSSDSTVSSNCYIGGAGGGGGGTGGGKGADAQDTVYYNNPNYRCSLAGQGASSPPFTTRADGNTYNGGSIASSEFGNDNCSGGNGTDGTNTVGGNGKAGAIKIFYLSYGPGGSGGGAGGIVPKQGVKVTPEEILTIKVGSYGKGCESGKIGADGIKTTQKCTKHAEEANTVLYRGSTILLQTYFAYNGGGSYLPFTGSDLGQVFDFNTHPFLGTSGRISKGYNFGTTQFTLEGFSTESGHTAGDGQELGAISYSNKTTGGSGGQTKLFGKTSHCVSGSYGTEASPEGGNAIGYGGCGGGGGYGLHDGGNGAVGYARISWNKYYIVGSEDKYQLGTVGGGGGGAAGNAITYQIPVTSGEHIKIRIGKGGTGAFVNNNTVTESTRGGDTIFAPADSSRVLKAGGGGGGKSANIVENVLTGGTGGVASNLCSYGGTDQTSNTNDCNVGSSGSQADNANGGKGGSLNVKKISTNYSGSVGGLAGDNAYGKNAVGFGAGGGGAGLLDVGTPSLATYNPNTGGNGANGKITIRWYE